MTETRPHLKQAKYGAITQGSVFTCAYASRYDSCDVLGMAITARCDFAQRKYPVLNYVPVVSLNDWLQRDGLDILVEQEMSDQQGKLKRMLRQAKVSEALPQSIPLRQIAEVHFPEGNGTKAQKTASKNFHELVEEIETFNALFAADEKLSILQWFRRKREKQVEELVRRLSRHAVLGHYFLEKLEPEEDESIGFVCLLREVSTVARPVAERLGKGLDQSTYSELCDKNSHSSGLSIPEGELAMPVVEIGSPTIEHILQSFGNLFGRIGVADPVEDVIREIVDNCLVDAEGAHK